jgi:hypothetical protein
MLEQWKFCKEVKSSTSHKIYEVSTYGEVRSYNISNPNNKKLLKPVKAGSERKYLRVSLGRANPMYIHRLVYLTFMGDIPKGLEINHLDGDTTNNRVDNLEVVTPAENSWHRVAILKRHGQGVRSVRIDITLPNGKLYTDKTIAETALLTNLAVNTIRNSIHTDREPKGVKLSFNRYIYESIIS